MIIYESSSNYNRSLSVKFRVKVGRIKSQLHVRNPWLPCVHANNGRKVNIMRNIKNQFWKFVTSFFNFADFLVFMQHYNVIIEPHRKFLQQFLLTEQQNRTLSIRFYVFLNYNYESFTVSSAVLFVERKKTVVTNPSVCRFYVS